MKRLRRLIFWSHLLAGLTAGVIILVMAVTGTLLSFERQITTFADGFHLAPSPHTLSIPELLGEKRPISMLFQNDPIQPVSVKIGKAPAEFIDPTTGKSLGSGNAQVRAFFHTTLTLHRSLLGQEGTAKSIGKSITGAASLVFLFLVTSGLFLWFPRRWTLRGLKAITLLRWKLPSRTRHWNWHHALGFWFAIPLILITTSGIIMAYPWANSLLFKLAGEAAPTSKPFGRKPSQPATDLTGTDAALALVQSQHPAWKSIQLEFPSPQTAQFLVSDSHRGRPDQQRKINVDLATTQILKSENGLSALSPARQARTWTRWIHTGEVGGAAGQVLAAAATLTSIVLIWTGFALSYRRFFKKRPA